MSFIFFFSSRRRHTRFKCDWSSDVCSSDLFSGQICPDFNIDDVHRRVLDELATEFGWSALTVEDRAEIVRAWHALDAWPDFPAAQARLRRRHIVASFTILTTSLIVDVSRKNGIGWDCVVSCH